MWGGYNFYHSLNDFNILDNHFFSINIDLKNIAWDNIKGVESTAKIWVSQTCKFKKDTFKNLEKSTYAQ